MMFEGISRFIKKIINDTDRKKLIENSLVVVIIGIILVIAGSTLFGGSKGKEDSYRDEPESVQTGKNISQKEDDYLVNELESILSQIDGAGRVDVMITYSSGKEMVPAYDRKTRQRETQEKDSNGGTRIIQESDTEDIIVYEDVPGGGRKPVFTMERLPEVKGVVVVADGASVPTVKENLVKAVQALLDVPPHRVQVFERKK